MRPSYPLTTRPRHPEPKSFTPRMSATVSSSSRHVSVRTPRWSQLINPASVILVCAVGLLVLGVTVLFSASMSYRSDAYFFVRRQITWLGFALLVGFIAARINLERFRRFTWWLVGALVIGLVLVLIPSIGVSVNGSRRWFELGFMRLQISEFAKIGLVYALAHYLAANQTSIGSFRKGFLLPFAAIGGVCLLLMKEPDFGSAALFGAVGIAVMVLAGVRMVYLIPSAALAVAGLITAIRYDPVRWMRITGFINLEEHRDGISYQLWQAILAFGAGGVGGVGLGNGRQQMAFLPEAHTDFIFAIIGEELGLVFTLAVVVLFVGIFIAGIVHLRRAPNLFHYLIVAGSLLMLTLQAIINLGVVTGLMPTKGMSLPFISYGGSNLLLMAIIVGLMINTQTAWSRPVLKERDRGLKELAV